MKIHQLGQAVDKEALAKPTVIQGLTRAATVIVSIEQLWSVDDGARTEFARASPALAPMLAERSGDPDVERLLEGVALLTGRVWQKLDDELPHAVQGIAQLLFPDFVRPLQDSADGPEACPFRGEKDSAKLIVLCGRG